MSQQHEVHRVDETLRPIKELEALVAFLKKRRNTENESEIADNLCRREYLHFRWIGTGRQIGTKRLIGTRRRIGTGRGSSEVLDSFYHSSEFSSAPPGLQ